MAKYFLLELNMLSSKPNWTKNQFLQNGIINIQQIPNPRTENKWATIDTIDTSQSIDNIICN